MKVAIASGKGGTGKTSLAVALLQANSERARLLDCDVEEPNCHLFLSHTVIGHKAVELLIPQVNPNLCKLCGKCVEACQFNAIAIAGNQVMIFNELCHSCGGCARICPHGAIQEFPVKIGELSQSRCKNEAELLTGTLEIGHASAPAVIKAAKKALPLQDVPFTLIDSPPGTACTFVAAVEDSDFVFLVTEATPFGLNDLKLAVEALLNMELPFAIIVNRIQSETNLITDYANQQGFPIWLQIPEDRHIAETYARGGNLLDVKPELKKVLRELLDRCQP